MKKKKNGIYCRCVKRILDICCALAVMIVFCWLYAVVAILVRVKLGSPVIFRQIRPGRIDPKTGGEVNICLCKFRTMTDERDAGGKLLPDDVRLTAFGRWLRSTSMDELPEVWNILRGDMSVVGPRPQLVRDMVFMSPEQRRRHKVRPGLTGLAQVRGRNAISWEEKFAYDLEYVKRVSFWEDLKICFLTVRCLVARNDVSADGMATSEDYGDYLLRIGAVSAEEYERLQEESRKLLPAAK